MSADVSHLPLNEYLPPVQEATPVAPVPTNEYLPPVQQPISTFVPGPAPGHQLADDGYRYKTQRRVVYRRHRRDVSHLPANEYLPPVQQEPIPVVYPTDEYLTPVAGHELADDGYHYKTQRRVVYRRNRRDVSHFPVNDYLPPVQQEFVPVDVAPIQEVSNAVVEEPSPAHQLADDGYRYKTQRRVVYRRNRRDVSHLPNSEYLPPVQEVAPVLDAPVQDITVVQEPAPAHELSDDGYRYKTQRRVVYRRNRRDVNHLVSNEYLPPVHQEFAPVNEYLPPVQQDAPAQAHILANDGYRYKTQRRVVFRRH